MSNKSSKEILLLELMDYFLKPSIKPYINEIAALRTQLLPYTRDEEETFITNKIRDKVQIEAFEAWCRYGRRGAVLMATGAGKSRVGIMAAKEKAVGIGSNSPPSVLLAVPTEKLRDTNWKEEFSKAREISTWDSSVRAECYASLGNIIGESFRLTILDKPLFN